MKTAKFRMMAMVGVGIALLARSACAGFDVSLEPDGSGAVQARAGYSWKFDQGVSGKPLDVATVEADGNVPLAGGGGGSAAPAPRSGVMASVYTHLENNWGKYLSGLTAVVTYGAVAANNDMWPFEKKDDKSASEDPPASPLGNGNTFYGPVFVTDGNGNTYQYNSGEGSQTSGDNGATSTSSSTENNQ